LADFARGEELFELRDWINWECEERRGRRTRAGMSIARSGMWMSPITRTSRDVMVSLGRGGVCEGFKGRSQDSEDLCSSSLHA
jgi:hypothetical protein